VIEAGARAVAAHLAGDVVRRHRLDDVVASLRSYARNVGLSEADAGGGVPF
jgi:hypothetical protein